MVFYDPYGSGVERNYHHRWTGEGWNSQAEQRSRGQGEANGWRGAGPQQCPAKIWKPHDVNGQQERD